MQSLNKICMDKIIIEWFWMILVKILNSITKKKKRKKDMMREKKTTKQEEEGKIQRFDSFFLFLFFQSKFWHTKYNSKKTIKNKKNKRVSNLDHTESKNRKPTSITWVE